MGWIDQGVDPETIEVTLTYFVGVGAPGGGGLSETHRVVLHNGRRLAGRFTLEREGFRFLVRSVTWGPKESQMLP